MLMKKLCIVVIALFFCIALYAQPKERHSSGTKTASFGVFSVGYDTYFSPLFWDQNSSGKFSVYTGIENTTLSMACAGYFNNDWYGAFLFEEKITNYKWWPENMTDESWTFLFGYQDSFMVKAGYYDFCYSGGKGTAEPYLYLGTQYKVRDKILRVSGGVDIALQYSKGNTMDVFQPKGHILLFFGENIQNGIGLEYYAMGTYAGFQNTTNVTDIPLNQKIAFWWGKIWDFSSTLSVGIRPYFFAIYNAINPTVSLNNIFPDENEYEMFLRIPLAIQFYPGNQNYFSLITSLQIQLYYASFDHLGYEGLGGNNYGGWVPGIGLGFGLSWNLGSKCFLQCGFQYIAQPELTENLSEHEYYLEGISVQALLQRPLTVSLQIKL